MELTERIEQLIEPTVADLGFDIVRIQLSGKDSPVLQVMAERRDGAAMIVDDCADISRAISAVLDVDDPIDSGYTLEVSSPGLDRPLVRLRDFERYAGHQARIEMDRLIDGQRRFKGRLQGVDGETIQIQTDGGLVGLPYTDVKKAKLIVTDDMLAAAEESQEG
ncbi:MAG: ribosome maturation factor RimP [Rhodospirillales bacterium]|nr:ribosome maturation factor RimP [Rhodospirillales bacterium]